MMLHRHFEEDQRAESFTKMENLSESSDTTDPNDPLYVPVTEKPRRGRPPKEVKHEAE